MQENKYYYEGITLTDYCKGHGLNVSSVRTRIWKKRNNPKYEKYTDQEIVDMVVKSCGTGIKYMYGDISLRQYCIEHGIQPATITSRINAIKKKNTNLTNDELVKMAVDEFENNNYTLFYQGIPLKDYCSSHPEILYNTLRAYIKREKDKNPLLSTDDIVEEYLKKEHFGRYKYYYCGIPLLKYCEEKKYSYEAIKGRIYRYKCKNPYLSDDEVVCAIMDEYEPFSSKYNYKGMTLSQYCKDNDISYYSVVSFVKRRLIKDNTLSVDDLIDEGIKTIKRYGIIYYYDGVPLRDYAIEHGLNASSIRASILRKKRKTNLPIQEIVNECVEMYREFSVKYFYGDETLLSFCRRTSINYNTVIHKYIDLYANRKDIEINDAIVLIVDEMLKNPRRRTKYYYGDDSLASFCRKNGYSYSRVYRKLMSLEKKYIYDSQEEAVVDAVLEYKIGKIREINAYLDVVSDIDDNVIAEICDFLKINLENLYDLIEMGFEYKQALMMIWWFATSKDDCENMNLTDSDIEEIFGNLDVLCECRNGWTKYSLRMLVGLYKSNLLDTRELILEVFNGYIFRIINDVCSINSVTLKSSDLDYFVEEVSLYILVALDKIFLGDEEYIRNNMELMVKSMLEKKIKKVKVSEYKLVKEN